MPANDEWVCPCYRTRLKLVKFSNGKSGVMLHVMHFIFTSLWTVKYSTGIFHSNALAALVQMAPLRLGC
ncbi:hypothetical protein BdWA1_001924 [Babesia duncani]|uniref:Uncharacterized protein n=1 Tax=Babesia duncani TaxID=323732 RepID=A0AAD9UPD3_9APIC|nr:hypothetical protein BdWA1_001924 [Babesia duncani]